VRCASNGNEGRLDREEAMAKGAAAVILVILIIGAISGYFFYTRYVQGTVVLSISDPAQAQPGSGRQYDTSILHIYLTFARMELHQGGLGNPSNSSWYTIVGSQKTVDMISVLTVPETLGSARLATGTYDQLRFPVSAAVVTFSGNRSASCMSRFQYWKRDIHDAERFPQSLCFRGRVPEFSRRHRESSTNTVFRR